ncbi:caspase family protein [Methylocystis sp. WRRC1]|uniref:caspase family protein n=1 Tax=Methylocystis sp. WRRC1 TaxID=1732014 RepID=UPI001D14AAEA|nr:caspase domain-containing protein [Methylocystis sp. WRRC1]MCC3247398.1 caspase family protein [Methylocystis sp. WRRC1]
MRFFRFLALAFAAVLALAAGQAHAEEKRLALVVGEAAYPSKPLSTAANDAGLVAQTLQAAGFDVTGARDLEETALKQAFRDFLDKAAGAGPDAVAFIYFSGYGLQLEGENYLVPIDAAITRDSDIPMRALRVSDYLKPLAASGAKLSIVVLDAARPNPFKMAGQPIAGGLALYEPGARALLAFNAAPGTVAPEDKGDYGAYAHALAEMIRDGGRPLMDVFDKVRLRVSDVTKGAEIPWNSSKIETDFVFFQREADAPPLKDVDGQDMNKPLSALGPEAGFSAAVQRDTLQGYQDYVATYPSAPQARRARAMAATRREALTWRRTRVVDTPNAYWSYLRRYPKGPHVWDARRRLAEISQAPEPPPSFEPIEYDYAPPPVEEIVYVERPVVYFDDPEWDFAPPPPPPVYLLPPPPPNFVVLPPPVIIAQPYVLPTPVYVPVPVWQRPPPYIAPPPNDFIYRNLHNEVLVDPGANNVVVKNPQGHVISTGALTAAGAGAAAVGVGAALPHFIAKRTPAVPPVPGAVAPGVGPAGVVAPVGGVTRPGIPGAQQPVGATPIGGPLGKPGAPLPGGAAVAPTPGTPGAPLPGAIKPGAPAPGTPPAGAIIPPKGEPGSGDHALPKPAPDVLKPHAPIGKPATPPDGTATPPIGDAGPKDHAAPKPAPAGAKPLAPPPFGKPATPAGGAGASPNGEAGPKDRGLTKPAPDGAKPLAPPTGAPMDKAPPALGRPGRGGRGVPAPDMGGAPDVAPKPPAGPKVAPRPNRGAPVERPNGPRGMDGGSVGAPQRSMQRMREPVDRLAPPREAPLMQPRMREAPPPMQPRMRETPPQMRAPAPIDRGPPAGMMRPPPPAVAPMMRPPPPQPGPGGGGAGPRGMGGPGGPPGFR